MGSDPIHLNGFAGPVEKTGDFFLIAFIQENIQKMIILTISIFGRANIILLQSVSE